MPDFAQFFEQALAEYGIDATVRKGEDSMNDTFYIQKDIGGETFSYVTSINTTINTTPEQLRKQIAREARYVSDEIENKLVTRFDWGERHILVSPYEDGWAECEHCGTRVSIPEAGMQIMKQDAELSIPQPRPIDAQRALNNLDDGSRMLLKMYLIGRLRASCDERCPNNKFNDDRSHLLPPM